MKLLRIKDLEELNYFELFPGRIYKGYLNEESIYINDDSFSFIVAAVKRGYEPYKAFNSLEIDKNDWKSVIRELINLKDIILSNNNERLEEYISIFFIEESIRKWKLEEYLQISKLELVSLINQLIEWIEAQLEINEVITLIGL